MSKAIIVHTNDPAKKKLRLVVKGPVEKVVTIDPPSVYLQGEQGQTVKSEVTVKASEKYPFNILEMKHNEISGIHAQLNKPEKKGDAWKIVVTATSSKVTNLYDNLLIRTDSTYVPFLRIRVSILFMAPQVPQS